MANEIIDDNDNGPPWPWDDNDLPTAQGVPVIKKFSLFTNKFSQPAPAPLLPEYEFPAGMSAFDLFEREKVPSDFVLPGFVAGTVGALIAPGSTGKSMLAMEIASIVAGSAILGDMWAPENIGSVVILAIEDPENELYNRWHDLGKNLNDREKELNRNIHVIPMFGQQFDIMNQSCFNALIKLCMGKRLLILDTLRRIHKLEENDSGAMANVVAKLEEFCLITKCSVLFLHHTTKASVTDAGGAAQQASRGSSVLVDNIRFQMYMMNMTAKMVEIDKLSIKPEDFRLYVKMGISKVNYGAKIGDIWLVRNDGGILTPVSEFDLMDVNKVGNSGKIVNSYLDAKNGKSSKLEKW